ncbi:MAG: hypothetical protein ACTSRX_09300, partial [Promethearchaeota archaeon]
VAHLTLKSGVLGIRVSIMDKNYLLPDYVEIRTGIFEEKPAPKELTPVDKFYQEDKNLPAIKDVDEEARMVDELFDETSDSKETILETDEDTLKKDEVFEELSTPEEKSEVVKVEETEDKPKKKKKTTKKKKSTKKKTTKKKTTKKKSTKKKTTKKKEKEEEK